MLDLSLRVLCLTCCFCLAGCGNAYERISVGEWTEVGQPEPPVGGVPGEFVVETRVEGGDRIVRAGDLVKIRILGAAVPTWHEVIRQEPHVAWLWVGREPAMEMEGGAFFGNLGSARLRRALIGRRLHEQFKIQLEKDVKEFIDVVPLRGIVERGSVGRSKTFRVNGKIVQAPEWKHLELVHKSESTTSAEIEVLNVCTAKLLRRTAVLRQWGYVLNMFDMNYGPSRKGILGWTAIEAQCPSPDGQFRLQAGPFYDHASSKGGSLLGWEKSYSDLRPPEKFPEEWEVIASK